MEGGARAAAAATATAAGPRRTSLFGRPTLPSSALRRPLSWPQAGSAQNPSMRALDEDFGDIASTIADIQSAIIRQLEERVLDDQTLLLIVGARISEIDVLASFASASRDFGYCRPTLIAGEGEGGERTSRIIAVAARHPLQERRTEAGFVPNDVCVSISSSY